MVSKAECQCVIIFLVCLLKFENVRAQCERPNLQGERQLTSDSYLSSYPDGSTAEFKCSVGYLPVDPRASKVITCHGMMWTNLELQCKKKPCGALQDFDNGIYTFSPDGDEGVLFGAIATPKCNKGYVLTGLPRLCKDEGWDERAPVCETVKCLPPKIPEHGKTDEPLEEVYGYPSVITYYCDEGYIPPGSLSISCLENGTFQTPQQCKKLPCDNSEFDTSAIRTGAQPPYKFGSLVTFQCRKGYELKGAKELKCEASGWSSNPPQCIARQVTTTRQPTKATTPRTTRPATKERINPPSPTNPPPHNNGMTIGLAVGIPLALLALLVGWYLYKKRSSTHGYSGNVAKNEDGQL